jgi:hypothetical protein
MKIKQENLNRINLTLDYLTEMTFDSHNYENWKDIPIEHRSSIAIIRKLISNLKGKNKND